VVKGISEKPVCLVVDDEKVSILDASDLWGSDTYATTDALVEGLGGDFSVMAIGAAGERLVRFAAPVFDKQHMPGRCHAGTVLGCKRLKAIAVRGTGEVPIHDPEAFAEAVEDVEKRIKDFPGWLSRAVAGSMGCSGKGWQGVDYEELTRRYTKRGPPGVYCPCKMKPLYGCNFVTDIGEGPHAGTTVACAGLTLYSGMAEQLRIGLPAAYRINDLCQRHGMDMFGSLFFAVELYRRGLMDKEDTGGVDLGPGNEDGFLEMLDMIVHRRGMGDVLAEGAVRAAERLGKGSERHVSAVKGLETMRLDPRAAQPPHRAQHPDEPEGRGRPEGDPRPQQLPRVPVLGGEARVERGGMVRVAHRVARHAGEGQKGDVRPHP
jgi:aldehyde:ferredoxin oxidoreductase